ncbi:MAG: T9SS type A sorting domain-containing protein [Bacteroidales bacterium]|nr:T9SS type A sorting domain-containing protein [Bacteroidales bacterium]
MKNFTKLILLAFFGLGMAFTAKAQTYYDLWVAGVQVTEDNATDILGNGTASFNPSTNTLNLNGINITQGYNAGAGSNDYAGIRSNMQISTLNINLQGENHISVYNAGADFAEAFDIYSADIVFSGSGSAFIAARDYGVYATKSVTINGGSYSIYGDMKRSIYAIDNINLNGGYIACYSSSGAAMEAYNGSITINPSLTIYEGDAVPGAQVSQLSGNPTMKYVNIANTTGIDEDAASNTLVYPNPVSHLMTVKTDAIGGTAKLFDITGRCLYSYVVTEETDVIDMSAYNTGLYFLQVNKRIIKIIKK